ncbi:MAG: cysteine desulfurase [Proteobacteria bacterium]|nr:cysteine desulfurase [Pseudomonadota bacterium]
MKTLTPPFDLLAIRKDFPILHQKIHEKLLIYFDNAATTQKPLSVIEAIEHYYSHDNSNVHRGIHTLSERATIQFEEARGKVQHFINAHSRNECIFVRGTTEGINLVAQSFVRPRIQPGEIILVTEMEHHSNIVPWQIICRQTGALLRAIPINDQGEIEIETFKKMLVPEVKFLAITHVSNALGTINPIKEIIKIAKDHGVDVLVDGAQATGHLRVDVQDLGCDFYAFSGHKMYAPTGIGVLYGKAELLDMMAPYQGGGEMITQVTFAKTEYAPIPQKFEAGTPNISGAIALGAAIDYLLKLEIEKIHEYENQLLEYATEEINKVKGIILVGTAKEKSAIISFNLAGVHAHDVGTILNNEGIAIRSGHHCAMPVMERFGVAATARASLAFYNTKEEIDRFIEVLKTVEEVFI